MDPAADDDDARVAELETLEAIYPEIRRISPQRNSADPPQPVDGDFGTPHSLVFELEVLVEPTSSVTVTFPVPSAQQRQHRPDSGSNGTLVAAEALNLHGDVAQDSLQVSHLPPLCLRICLPSGYPETVPLQANVSTTPPWLPEDVIQRLESEAPRLWEESGRDIVAFAYVDHVQREAADVFGAIAGAGTLEVHPDHKLAVLDYDIKAKKETFEAETFECGVCLDPKKGTKCHKMLDCGHIFCLECLQSFYDDAIQEGNISTVRCLTPNCAKERTSAAAKASTRPTRKPNALITPSELLQIGLSEETVKRYVTLKYKTELESDKNTIYCPRQWCNGAARSKKHKKPSGLEFAQVSDDDGSVDSDDDDGNETNDGNDDDDDKKRKNGKLRANFNPADLLAVCEDCGYAFCSRCEQSWHGEFIRCVPRRNKGVLTQEEKASLAYLEQYTSPCPTCNAPAQKTQGCNHMICSRCETHFCYLCSAWLDPTNPYKHYNTQPGGKATSCYMRLWELEEGDGEEVGNGFVRRRAPLNEAEEVPLERVADAALPDFEAQEDGDGAQPPDHQRGAHPPQPAVALEAPLVLRLIDNEPRGRGHDAPHVAPAVGRGQPAPRGGAARRGDGGVRGARARGPRGGGRGRARGAAHRGRGGANALQGQGQGQGQGHRQDVAGGRDVPADANAGGLDPAQEAWVRRFVEMALIDAEHLVEGDSDDDDADHWRIR